MSFRNPEQEQIRQLLYKVHNFAVVGLSPNPARPSFRVARELQGFGYRIIPVRPFVSEILGEKAFTSLESLPEIPNIVDVFVPQNTYPPSWIVASNLASRTSGYRKGL